VEFEGDNEMRATCPVVFTLILFALAAPGLAGESRSAPLAAQLRQMLSDRGLTAVATSVPDQPDRFVAASLVPGLGLLVLSARSTAAPYIAADIARKQYDDAYSYLNGTAVADGKIFVQDSDADGLLARPSKKGALFDITYESVTRQVRFDGEPAAQHMTPAQYQADYAAVDAAYANMLSCLIAELGKSPTR
jgi:hypothetical protein